MADYLARLAVLIGADSSELQRELNQSVQKTEAAADRIEKRTNRMGVAIGAGVAAAAVALGAVVNSAIDRADEINTVAEKIGTSAGRLSELAFAAEQSGSGLGALDKSITRLNRTQGEALAGNEKSIALFRALGIEIADSSGKARDSQDLFADLADRIASIPDPAQQTAVAMQALGKGGAELVPLLRGGSAGLAELRQQARDTGAALTDQGAKGADDFNDALARAKLQVLGVGTSLLNNATPALVGIVETLGNAAGVMRDGFGAAAEFVEENIDGLTAAAIFGGSVIAGQYASVALGAVVTGSRAVGTALAAGALRVIEYTNFMGAASAANTAFGASTAAARVSLLSFVGGPLGAAVLGVGALTAAIYYWGDGASDAEKAIDSLREATERLNEAEGLGIQASIEAAAATREKAQASLEAAVAKLKEQEATLLALQQSGPARGKGLAEDQAGERIAATRAEIDKLVGAIIDLDAAETDAGLRRRKYAEEREKEFKQHNLDLGAIAGGHDRAKESADRAAEAEQRLSQGFADAAESIREANAATEQQQDIVAALRREMNPYLQANEEYRRQLEAINALELQGLIASTEAVQLRKQATTALREHNAEIERQRDAVSALQSSLQDDIRLAGLSSEARAQEVRAMRAVEEARRAIAAAQAAGETFTDAEIAGIKATTVALSEQAYQAQQTAQQIDRTSEEIADSLGGFAVDAITDFDNIGEAWDGLLDDFGNMAKRAVAQAISEFLKLRVIQPLISSLFGGSGGGGIGSVLSSFFGGGSGAPGGGVGASFVGPLQPGAAAAAAGQAGLTSLVSTAAIATAVYSIGSQIATALGGNGRVGGLFGGLVGALFGSKGPDFRLGGIGVTRKPEGTFSTELGAFSFGARGIDGAEKELVKLVTEFDQSIATIIGSFTNGSDQLAEVREALAKFSVDLKGDAITAERLLGDRFNAILATFDEDVREFVGATGTVQERAARLADAAVIVAGVEAGFADTFDELAGILKDNQIEGEALTATYQRVVSSFNLMDGVLDGLGLTTARTREEFIKFSAGVVQALGGLDAASSVINRNLGTYLSPEEQRQIRLTAAQSRVDTAGAAAGITGNLSNSEFKDLLQRALAGEFDPDKTAAILRYGAALADVNEIIAEGAETTGAAAPVATVLDPSGFNAAAAAVRETLADFGRTEYQRALQQARTAWQATTAEILNLAQEGGVEVGQTLAATTDAFQLFVYQQTELLAGLKKSVLKDLINLYGNNAAPVREFASELDLFQNGLRQSSNATQDWAAQLERLERLDAATTLARNLRDLFEDGGQSVLEGLAEFKVPIKDLLRDLGLDFQNLTSPASVAAFGRAARLLGLTAEELASIAGIDLSALTEEQRASIGQSSAQKPDAQKGVTDGLDKVTTATEGVEDAVAFGLAEVVRELRALRGLVNNKGPAAFDPFAAAGVPA